VGKKRLRRSSNELQRGSPWVAPACSELASATRGEPNKIETNPERGSTMLMPLPNTAKAKIGSQGPRRSQASIGQPRSGLNSHGGTCPGVALASSLHPALPTCGPVGAGERPGSPEQLLRKYFLYCGPKGRQRKA